MLRDTTSSSTQGLSKQSVSVRRGSDYRPAYMHNGPWPSSAEASHVKPRPSTAQLCLPSCPSAMFRSHLRPELYWRSIRSELLGAAGADDLWRCIGGCLLFGPIERFSPRFGFVFHCRSFGGGSPIPQLFRKNSEIPGAERACAAN